MPCGPIKDTKKERAVPISLYSSNLHAILYNIVEASFYARQLQMPISMWETDEFNYKTLHLSILSHVQLFGSVLPY